MSSTSNLAETTILAWSPGPAERARVPAEPRRAVLQSIAVGLVAVAIAFTWQFLQVHYLYNNNWTSLFYTGEQYPMPASLVAQEDIYRFSGVYGYDGQLYHLVAHDLLFRRGFSAYVDIPRLRYRRILVSALAALLSFGQDAWVDNAYRLVILGFLFLGSYWLAQWSQQRGRSAAWGLLFIATPAAIASGSLMVTDVALAALAMGAIWYAEQRAFPALFVTLAAAALVRETGFLLPVAWCVWLAAQRQFRQAAVFSSSMLPAVMWWAFVQFHTAPGKGAWLSLIPFAGIVQAFSHPLYGSLSHRSALIALDRIALVGMIVLLLFVYRDLLRPRSWSYANFTAFAFASLATFLGSGGQVWPEVTAFGRVFSPLVLIAALPVISSFNWWRLLPLALILPRMLVVLGAHLVRILQPA